MAQASGSHQGASCQLGIDMSRMFLLSGSRSMHMCSLTVLLIMILLRARSRTLGAHLHSLCDTCVRYLYVFCCDLCTDFDFGS